MSNRKPRGAAPAAPAPAPGELMNPNLVPPPALPVETTETVETVLETPVLDPVSTTEASVDKTVKAVETKKKPAAVVEKPMKVRATAKGFYGNVRRVPGEVFEIHSEKLFSHNWMEKI